MSSVAEGRLPGITLAQPVAVSALCDRLGGAVDPGARSRTVAAIAEPSLASSLCLAPILSRKFVAQGLACDAVLLVDGKLAPAVAEGRRWVHDHASWVLASLLDEVAVRPIVVRHSSAVIEDGAKLGDRVEVGAGAVLLAGCEVGDDCSIGPNAVVYGCARLGCRVTVGAGAVVGRPGFGWVAGPSGQVRRMPQPGGVIAHDDVEIGALATVDSGTLHPTVLENGCKLDAHVHVGHNVRIGAGTMIAAQAGFAGSSKIGRGVLVGGQAGVADHVVVGDGARLSGKAGVIGNVPPATTVAGYPAVERIRWLRSIAKALRGKST